MTLSIWSRALNEICSNIHTATTPHHGQPPWPTRPRTTPKPPNESTLDWATSWYYIKEEWFTFIPLEAPFEACMYRGQILKKEHVPIRANCIWFQFVNHGSTHCCPCHEEFLETRTCVRGDIRNKQQWPVLFTVNYCLESHVAIPFYSLVVFLLFSLYILIF